MENLKSKVVIITGASSGIGEATARLLARHGASIVLAARSADRLQAIVNDIGQHGTEAVYLPTDVTSLEDMRKLADLALEKFGRIDVLVNNAGIAPNSLLHELKIDQWNETIDVNIKGVLYGIAAVLPTMREQQYGHIINVSSVLGHKVIPTTAVYSASKFAVRAISEGLMLEESPSSHVRSTIISPGMTATGMQLEGYPSISPSSVAEAIAFAISQPDDVAVNEIVIRPTLQAL